MSTVFPPAMLGMVIVATGTVVLMASSYTATVIFSAVSVPAFLMFRMTTSFGTLQKTALAKTVFTIPPVVRSIFFPAPVTVTAAVPVTLSADAVTVVLPVARAVKSPVASTVPTVSLLLVQANVTLVITLPSWSFAVAANCRVAPTATSAVAGVTSIAVSTGSVGAPFSFFTTRKASGTL